VRTSTWAKNLILIDALPAARRLTLVPVCRELAAIGHLCDRVTVMRAGQTLEEREVERPRRRGVAG
jgi:ABC-type dipeptide/oligopeptide/nickel transport system ATPase component